MMTAESDFLQEIAEHPQDQACRLIYADWLEERGDPRGEFIRVQCELATLADNHPWRSALALRETKLLKRHGEAWRGALHGKGVTVTFRGGLIDEVTIASTEFDRLSSEISRLAPTLQSLRLATFGSFRMSMRAAWKLANSNVAPNLRGLDVTGCGVTDTYLRWWSNSTKLKRIRSLTLAWNHRISDEGIQEILSASNFAKLELLDLNGIALSPRAIELLRDADAAHGLKLLIVRRGHNKSTRRSTRRLKECYGERLMVC